MVARHVPPCMWVPMLQTLLHGVFSDSAGQAAASTAADAADAAMHGRGREATGRASGVTGGECVVGACAGGCAGSEEGSDEEASDEEAVFAAQVGP
jgi:hypothetical protein